MRIAVCSREALLGDALASLLSNEGRFDVVSKESTPRACLSATKDHRVQLVVLSGLGLQPNDLEFLMGARAYGDFAIVLVGDEELCPSDHNLDAILNTGASSQALFRAIREAGGTIVPAPTSRVRERRQTYGSGVELTRREYEVATLVSKGFSNRRIAETTGLREQSIKNLVSLIMRKLKCENRVQVALRLTSVAVLEAESR